MTSTGILAFWLVAACGALAEQSIGSTALSQNEVMRINGATGPVSQGDPVFLNEQVRTGQASNAKFVFTDETNLAVGPISTVTLDRFVYSEPSTYTRAAVTMAKGAFRFTSGASSKDAYEIRTGNATIGVRGTVLDILTRTGRTVVTLVEGRAVVCPRRYFDGDPRQLSARSLKDYHCAELLVEGDTVVVESDRATRGDEPFSFAQNYCSGNASLCSRVTYASARPDGVLCGR
jgi:hypothetical protein